MNEWKEGVVHTWEEDETGVSCRSVLPYCRYEHYTYADERIGEEAGRQSQERRAIEQMGHDIPRAFLPIDDILRELHALRTMVLLRADEMLIADSLVGVIEKLGGK